MRRVILIVVAAAALVAGGAYVFREWLNSAERSRDIARRLEQARTWNENDATRSDAIVALEEILKLDPDCLDAHEQLANACMRLQPPQLEKVIEHLERALEIAPPAEKKDVELFLAQAHLERYRGSSTDADFKASRDAFLEVMSDPELEAAAMYGYARLYASKGRNRDLNKALEKLDQLHALHPDFDDDPSPQELADRLRKALHGDEGAKDGG